MDRFFRKDSHLTCLEKVSFAMSLMIGEIVTVAERLEMVKDENNLDWCHFLPSA